MRARVLALVLVTASAPWLPRASPAAEVRVSTSPASAQKARLKPAATLAKRPARPALRLPAWAKKKPHFVKRGGKRFAVAVGQSSGIKNEALARNTAANRGRVDLLRLLKGQAPGSDVEGELFGAEVVDTFIARDGRVYVRVEAEAK